MRVIIRDDYEKACEWAALYIRKRITDFKPTAAKPFVLGLPTGSTPIGIYKRFVAMYKSGEISFKHVITFNMDEYVDLPKDHSQSYHSFMWEHLFKHIDIIPANVHILNGNAKDLAKECEDYERAIKDAGGIELFLGGVGHDGHVAFNEPGSSLTSRTRVKTLAYETIVANARFFENDIKKVPKMALTVGVGTIMDAREVLIVVTGTSKAAALAKCMEEGVNHMYTMSAIQMHAKSCIVCDEDATGELRVRTVKYFKGLEQVHNELIKKPIAGHLSAADEHRHTKKLKVHTEDNAATSPAATESATPVANGGDDTKSGGGGGGGKKQSKKQQKKQSKGGAAAATATAAAPAESAAAPPSDGAAAGGAAAKGGKGGKASRPTTPKVPDASPVPASPGAAVTAAAALAQAISAGAAAGKKAKAPKPPKSADATAAPKAAPADKKKGDKPAPKAGAKRKAN